MQSGALSFLRRSSGDVFDIRSQGEGRLLLVRLERPEPGPGMSRLSQGHRRCPSATHDAMGLSEGPDPRRRGATLPDKAWLDPPPPPGPSATQGDKE